VVNSGPTWDDFNPAGGRTCKMLDSMPSDAMSSMVAYAGIYKFTTTHMYPHVPDQHPLMFPTWENAGWFSFGPAGAGHPTNEIGDVRWMGLNFIESGSLSQDWNNPHSGCNRSYKNQYENWIEKYSTGNWGAGRYSILLYPAGGQDTSFDFDRATDVWIKMTFGGAILLENPYNPAEGRLLLMDITSITSNIPNIEERHLYETIIPSATLTNAPPNESDYVVFREMPAYYYVFLVDDYDSNFPWRQNIPTTRSNKPNRPLKKSNKERQDFWEDYINKN